MNLTLFKGKFVAAKKGYDLLKKKSDALKVRFREICKTIYDTKVGMGDLSSSAYFSLTQAEYAAGNFRTTVLEGQMTASIRVSSRTDNVAGVKLPVFTQKDLGNEVKENLGLVSGGRKISNCREKFSDYAKALIRLASLQTSFVAMDEALKVTNRRVNALENVTIPKIVEVLSMINRELDELEREDFTRLKKVQSNKQVQLKIEEEARKAEKAASLAAGDASPSTGSAPVSASSGSATSALTGYDAADDDDVVFK
jgi:V-type H+-transporting ATPase subunit D